MKTTFINSDNVLVEMDITEYQAICSVLAIYPILKHSKIHNRIYKHLYRNITEKRNKIKQEERIKGE